MISPLVGCVRLRVAYTMAFCRRLFLDGACYLRIVSNSNTTFQLYGENCKVV